MTSEERPLGLLYVEMECPERLEEEFHAWYNTDHLPERVALPGFVRSRRYAALEGHPRWLASYELESTAVLESAEYLRCMGKGQTAWTKRIVSLVNVYRGVYEHVWGQSASTEPSTDGNARGLLAIRYDGAEGEVSEITERHDGGWASELLRLPGVLMASHFRHSSPDTEHLALYELSDPWIVQSPEFAELWNRGWEQFRGGLSFFKRTLYVRVLPID